MVFRIPFYCVISAEGYLSDYGGRVRSVIPPGAPELHNSLFHLSFISPVQTATPSRRLHLSAQAVMEVPRCECTQVGSRLARADKVQPFFGGGSRAAAAAS